MTELPPPASPEAETTDKTIDWNAMLAPYRQPVAWKSGFQLGSTALLLALFWGAAAWSLTVGYWLTLLLAIPAAMMVVRLFMLQHDCGHGSFFRSQKLNNMVGGVLGVLHPGAVRLLAAHPRHPPRHQRQPRRPRPGRHRHSDRPGVPEPLRA